MEKYLGKDLTKKYFFPDNTEITNYLFEKKYFSLKKNENGSNSSKIFRKQVSHTKMEGRGDAIRKANADGGAH